MFAFGALTGCRSGGNLMPLEEKLAWTYETTTPLARGVEELKVTNRTSVGSVGGFRLEGPFGPSELGWQNGVLMASLLGGVRYDPPLPLVRSSGPGDLPKWEGTVRAFGRQFKASAEGRQEAQAYQKGASRYPGQQVTLRLRYDGKTLESVLHFADGIGLVSVEQRLDGEFQSSLRHLSGP